MKRQYQHNGFNIEAETNRNLMISREEEQLSFTPAECEKLTELAGILQKMRSLAVLPPKVSSGSFTARLEEDLIIFEHGTRRSSGLSIFWKELDGFVEALYNLQKIYLDMVTLSNGRATAPNGGFSEGLSH